MHSHKLLAQGTRYAALIAIGIGAASTTDAHAQVFSEIGSIASPIQATELIYSSAFSSLVLRDTASAVALVSATGGGALQFANSQFTDISLSPDGRYVYAADYGGENIGYGTPATQSYVHRADLTTGNWTVKAATLAGRVEATSADTFVLQSLDQWVTFTNNAWGSGSAITQLNTNTNWAFPGYFPRVYSGEFVYSATTGRLIHGNSALSSQELQVFKIQNNEFVRQEGSGIYGSAYGYGGSLALATDESTIYYGRLAVDALDVTHNLRIFPETIYAATSDVAFGSGNYYSTKTGALLGNLGFSTTVYGLNADGSDFWAYDGFTNQLRHFAMAVPEPTSFVLMFVGGIALVCVSRMRAKRHFA